MLNPSLHASSVHRPISTQTTLCLPFFKKVFKPTKCSLCYSHTLGCVALPLKSVQTTMGCILKKQDFVSPGSYQLLVPPFSMLEFCLS